MNRQDAKVAKVEPTKRVDQLARVVIGAAIEVHRHLGPGFLESVYKAMGPHLGLLINFNVPVLRAGVQRVILS